MAHGKIKCRSELSLTSALPRKPIDILSFRVPQVLSKNVADYEEYVDDEEGFALEAKNGKVTQVYYTATANDSGLCPDSYIKPSKLFSHDSKVLAELFCPSIYLHCPDEINGPNDPTESVNFSVGIAGGTPYAEPTYTWSVSAGKITRGQGTPTITLDKRGLTAGTEIKVTLVVGGLPDWCEHSSSCTYIVK